MSAPNPTQEPTQPNQRQVSVEEFMVNAFADALAAQRNAVANDLARTTAELSLVRVQLQNATDELQKVKLALAKATEVSAEETSPEPTEVTEDNKPALKVVDKAVDKDSSAPMKDPK